MHDLPPEGGRWTRSIKTGCVVIKTCTFVLVSRLGVMPCTSIAACSLFRLPDNGEAATTLTSRCTSRTHSLCTIHNLLDSAMLAIMAYGSTPHVGMVLKKKSHTRNVNIKLVRGFHEHYQALSSASMSNGTVKFAGEHCWSTSSKSKRYSLQWRIAQPFLERKYYTECSTVGLGLYVPCKNSHPRSKSRPITLQPISNWSTFVHLFSSAGKNNPFKKILPVFSCLAEFHWTSEVYATLIMRIRFLGVQISLIWVVFCCQNSYTTVAAS